MNGRIKIMIFISLLAIVAPVFSQAEAYFNKGAQFYIHGQNAQAIQVLTEGLKRYPNDSRLKALLEKIKNQQKQQNQQQQQQQQNQNSQQKQDKKQQQQQDSQKDQNNQAPPPKSENQPSQQDQKKQPQPQKGNPQKLTPEQAEQILKALEAKNDQSKKRRLLIPGKKKTVEKDW